MNTWFALLALGAIAIAAADVGAQELEPRSYADLPKGLNVIALAYSLSRGNVVTDPTVALQDFRVTTHMPALLYVRTFKMFNRLGRAQLTVPFAYLAGRAKLQGVDTSGTRTGFADARLRLGWNFVGSPALAPKAFRSYEQGTIVGASLVISVPIGQYNNTRIVNLGANRWGFKPELGISRRFGPWYAEAYTGVWLFTDNTDYLEGKTRTQDPIYSFQAHLAYAFPRGIWIALNGTYVRGGASSVDGVDGKDFQTNWRLGGTLSVPLAKQHSIKALFHSGVATRAGADFRIFTLAYQYSWF